MTCHVHVSEARTVGASVGIIAGRAVPTVARVAGAGVQAWPVVVAGSVGVTVVLADIVAWEDLGAGAASEGVPSAAVAVVRVGARIAAGAQAISAWSPSTVVDISAVHTIAIETGRTRVTGETLCRCRLVMAGHSIEARVPGTSVRVVTCRAVSAVPSIACTADLTRSIVIAHSVVITRISFRVFTRKDLGAGPTTERVSIIACTVERVGTGVAAGAARTTRCPSTVVDIGAFHTIAVGTVWTGVTGETLYRCWFVMADHISKAWVTTTSIRVDAGIVVGG
jgi:hypothetical protein